MLSRQDIIDFCGVSEGQVRAIAKRERVSDISAASLGQSLLQSDKGTKEIERYIHEEMENAISCGRVDKEKTCNRSSQNLEAAALVRIPTLSMALSD